MNTNYVAVQPSLAKALLARISQFSPADMHMVIAVHRANCAESGCPVLALMEAHAGVLLINNAARGRR